jgi:polar amino acid transport system substrate-binding protein
MTEVSGRLRSSWKTLLSECCRWMLAVFIALVGVAPLPLQAAEVLKFCFEATDVPPWRTVDATGLNFDLINSAATPLGIQIEYQALPWKRCLAELKSNGVDGIFAASFDSERLGIGVYPGGRTPDVAKRLHMDTYLLVRKKGSSLRWNGKTLEALEGAVGIQLGYSIGEQLKAMNLAVDDGSLNPRELVLKLIAGRIGAAAMLGSQARNLVKMDSKLGKEIEILPIALVEKPYYLMLSHAIANSKPDLANRLWKSIESERGSARYRKMEDEGLKNIRP